MSKPIIITPVQWDKLSAQIRKDYYPNITLLSQKLKRVLGFTVREYREYNRTTFDMKTDIRLDFYDEPKKNNVYVKIFRIFTKDRRNSRRRLTYLSKSLIINHHH